MRIVLVISVWLLLAAVCLDFWDLYKKNEALIERMESLEQAVEQRDRDLKQAEEAWQQKREALDEMEKANPDFYRMRRKTPPFRAGDIRRVRRICVSN